MRRYLLASGLSAVTLALTPLVALAQGQGNAVAGGPLGRTMVVDNPGGGNGLYVTALAKPPAEVFNALQVVYGTFKIPMTAVDPTALTLGTTQWTTPHWLAGHELSRYFDCGSGRGQSADEMSIKLTIRSRVSPDSATSGQSVLTTTILSITATDQVEGMRSRPCETTGELETRIGDEVAKLLK